MTKPVVAYVTEEQRLMKPMSKVMPGQHKYDGPEARRLGYD